MVAVMKVTVEFLDSEMAEIPNQAGECKKGPAIGSRRRRFRSGAEPKLPSSFSMVSGVWSLKPMKPIDTSL